MQGLLLLLLGRDGQGGIALGQRQREEGGEEGHGLGQWQAVLHQESLQFVQLLLRRFLALEAQRHPLQQIDYGIQRGILVVGRTLTRRQPRLGLARHLFLQHVHEARFPDTRFATQQHHLPEAVLDLGPALQEQPDFLLAPHQGGQARAPSRIQAAAGHTFIQDLIDLQRLGEAFQQRWA